ncbi:TM2 domain-containing protein [Bacillus manliponensis]|uniref:Membrane protein n=1 Tax=Bacillus manliponensis TaxID=574376 RepID=A0A073K2J8_9BACI|nr:TM2 domain-containing protein [Bacillus manliponensis]KEK20725.1 membrane protein [Bacillus manliponensis]
MDNLLLKQDLSAEGLAMVNSEFEKRKKSKGIAYLIWFFLGGLGGHRYYARDFGMAIAMTLTLGGLGIWALIDVFFIGRRIGKKNDQVEREIILNVKAMTSAKRGA